LEKYEETEEKLHIVTIWELSDQSPLLARRGGRDIKEKWREASSDGADGVVVQVPKNISRS
jgi:hypothetical protein